MTSAELRSAAASANPLSRAVRKVDYTFAAIDPGHTESAIVILNDGSVPVAFRKMPNEELVTALSEAATLGWYCRHLVIEQIACMGMAVGAEVFETVFWSGRFAQAWEARRKPWSRVKRMAVKMHLCNSSRAKDANIRQALIDMYGGKEKAIGKKYSPGPLFGVKADIWAALAVAVTWSESPQVRSIAESPGA